MYVGFRTRWRSTVRTLSERTGTDGQVCLFSHTEFSVRSGARPRGAMRVGSAGWGRGHAFWVPEGVELMNAPSFHCHLTLLFTSGQQLGTWDEE
jgi:hypothetical protein